MLQIQAKMMGTRDKRTEMCVHMAQKETGKEPCDNSHSRAIALPDTRLKLNFEQIVPLNLSTVTTIKPSHRSSLGSRFRKNRMYFADEFDEVVQAKFGAFPTSRTQSLYSASFFLHE